MQEQQASKQASKHKYKHAGNHEKISSINLINFSKSYDEMPFYLSVHWAVRLCLDPPLAPHGRLPCPYPCPFQQRQDACLHIHAACLTHRHAAHLHVPCNCPACTHLRHYMTHCTCPVQPCCSAWYFDARLCGSHLCQPTSRCRQAQGGNTCL